MSDDQDVGSQMTVDSETIVKDRPDAVHGRFRPRLVRCDDCNIFIVGNDTAVREHFNSSHPSSKFCHDCEGKVFVYRTITRVKEMEISKEFVYHKCNHKEPKKSTAKISAGKK